MLDRLARVVERAQVRALKARLHACGENVAIYMPVVFSGPEAIDIGSHTSIAPFVFSRVQQGKLVPFAQVQG